MKRAGRMIAAVAAMAMLAGCDDATRTAAPRPPAKVEHAGTISGRVLFTGPAPRLPRIAVTGDEQCMAAHPDGVPDESVIVAGDGALANVFVYLKDAPRSDGSAAAPVLIDQHKCQYVPHAVAVQINQPLRVQSSDSVLHNVHVLGVDNQAINLSEPGPGEQTVHFEKPEMLHVRCDVHPWMKAVVGVFDSPCFAVSDVDGSFTIHNVPPGTYTLAAWHERFGEQTQKIIVPQDGSVEAKFSYSP